MQQDSTEAGYGSYRFVVGGAAWFLQFCMGMSFFSIARDRREAGCWPVGGLRSVDNPVAPSTPSCPV